MSQAVTAVDPRAWWNSLRHGGMLLDDARLLKLASPQPKSLSSYDQDRLRRRLAKFEDDQEAGRNEFVKFVLESVCGFERSTGEWYRGTEISASWTHIAITGEKIRPTQLWLGKRDAVLPVFIDSEKRIGMGRGVRLVGHALQWMRKTNNRLGLITNGQQWRLLYAGLSYEAYAEWDVRQWFSEGEPSSELVGLRTLLAPALLTPSEAGEASPFIEAINDSRKGQAELSEVLGERVRQAAELLIQGHTVALAARISAGDFTAQELYRAAVRMIMRLVVVLFAESREALLPRDNPIYFQSYSLGGLREQLERVHPSRLRSSYAGYPRIISLCRLVYEGSSHESLLVRAYGGQLFEPGHAESPDGVSRALAVLEHGCYEYDVMNDQQVHHILDLLSRTKIKIRQGRQSSTYAAAVDFSSLDSEYIGILYEGLLDFELRQAAASEPVIFLAVGNQPALPLATLEAMDDKALKNLLEKMKDTSSSSDGESDAEAGDGESADDSPADAVEASDETDAIDLSADAITAEETSDASQFEEEQADDDRLTARTRAENWARRAIEAGKLVTKPRGAMNDEKRLKYDADIDRKARQIITKVVLPGEWYLVRWGGTRKGSGTFYTRPQLAIPTVYRTLRPLCYDPPQEDAPVKVVPAKPEVAASTDGADLHLVADPESTFQLSGDGPVVIARDPQSGYVHETNAAPPIHTGSDDVEAKGRALHPEDAPLEDWIPKKPEQILDLKICDPACGSGTFPLSALRFLTDALYSSLHYYNRIQYYSDKTVIDLIVDQESNRTLAGELLPCRPEDNDFEARTKAVLRRYIVERCIYGVDLDPLAVELCRMSLWIETLDPRLPFTFLDHKIKPGNSLIGTWFDQFMHYPAMAWMREGGDKSHSNGVHYSKESWTRAIAAKVQNVKKELVGYIDGASLINKTDLTTVQTVHDQVLKEIQVIHRIGIHEADARAHRYHQLVKDSKFQALKFDFDRWCAIWFWPPEQIDACPLPLSFYENELTTEAIEIVRNLAQNKRFFHWELEFPDVFNAMNHGFDAILGNPPWETLQPDSKEFFSSVDPLYRTYGNQEAKSRQENFFQVKDLETEWLHYCSFYKELSNWMKYSGTPFGDETHTVLDGRQDHSFPIGNRGVNSFATSSKRHEKWKRKREECAGFADEDHAFRYQGGGKPYTHKLFCELAHGLLRDGGRLGFIVPSGIYSDFGAIQLRELFINHCRWEWLFGIENREKIFDIDSRFKFNPIIIQKGGCTDSIRTAFMRRDLNDWEHGEKFATHYPSDRVYRFSPQSKAILEIQSPRDLEVLEKIYINSVLLSDTSSSGWNISYAQGDFNMTSDSKLFPPRDKWEERGYRPDEYSRWIKGNWQPRTSDCPAPPNCKRVNVVDGVVLSRDQVSWIDKDHIAQDEFLDLKGNKVNGPGMALPLFEGRMIGIGDPSVKGWVRGKGRGSVWEDIALVDKDIRPQYLVPGVFRIRSNERSVDTTVTHKRIGSATNERSSIGVTLHGLPSGDTAAHFWTTATRRDLELAAVLSSLVFDSVMRLRLGGLHLDYHVYEQNPLPSTKRVSGLSELELRLSQAWNRGAPIWLRILFERDQTPRKAWRAMWAVTEHERLRLRCCLEAIVAASYGLAADDLLTVLRQCDYPQASVNSKSFSKGLDPKGFWRIDKQVEPERRSTILFIVAYMDLLSDLRRSSGDLITGVTAFLHQNNGEGWQLPESLRLADYGLGHDDRAKEHQPVRECFGPRFYDWQLEQDPEESWRECHLHARNLLGPTGYQALLDEIAGKSSTPASTRSVAEGNTVDGSSDDYTLSAEPVRKGKRRK